MRNGPKVNQRCLSKTRLYAGTSEYPALLVAGRRVTMRSVRTISREVAPLGLTPQRPHAGARRDGGQDMVRPAWRHAEVDRNDRPAGASLQSTQVSASRKPEE